jgi:branched-chain amino acid transport system substrate-binding protein
VPKHRSQAIRTAQEKFGKKPLTGEQVGWGLENLNLTAERLKQLGFENELQPIKVSCADHEGICGSLRCRVVPRT